MTELQRKMGLIFELFLRISFSYATLKMEIDRVLEKTFFA